MLAGCASTSPAEPSNPDPAVRTCSDHPVATTLWLGPGFTLLNETPEAGSVFSNGFDEAFLVDTMDEWTSAPAGAPMRLVGNLTLEFWVRNSGTPAPVVLGGAPDEGYHWFNQVGTNRGFVPDFGREYASVVPLPGSIDHYSEVISMPPGGLHVEKGDTLRVLLTSLVVDDTRSTGQEILFGGETPSSITFTHHCMASLDWQEVVHRDAPVSIAAHQGLITGAIPPGPGINFAEVPFDLLQQTQRLTISLTQGPDANPLKDDMDITIYDADGNAITSIGSPYADDKGTFYAANLHEMMPPGAYVVRVDSYSGHAYEGTVRILQDSAILPVGAM